MYDITSRESFNNLPRWIQDAREQASKDVTIAVVGNKRDLAATERAVPMLDASRFCQERDILFIETSALTGEAVVEVFDMITRRIIEKIQSGQIDPKSVANGIMAGDRSVSRSGSNAMASGGTTNQDDTKPGFFRKIISALMNSCRIGLLESDKGI